MELGTDLETRAAREERYLGGCMGFALANGRAPQIRYPTHKAFGGRVNQGIAWAIRKLAASEIAPTPSAVFETLTDAGYPEIAAQVSSVHLAREVSQDIANTINREHVARENRADARTVAKAVEKGDSKTAMEVAKEVAKRNLEAAEAGPAISVKLSEAIRLGLSKYAAEVGETPIKTGIPAIDNACVLVPGQTLVIGAATNVGKSTLGTTIGMNVSEQGVGFGMVSVEDDVTDFGVRTACALTGISPDDIWRGRLTVDQQTQIAKAFHSVTERNFQYSFVRDCDIAGVVRAIEHQAATGCRVIFVDYLQAITVNGTTLTGRENVDAVLNELIVTARRCGVALILASQVVRPSERKIGQEPTLYWLKESGSIENRAQCVVMLWRDERGEMFGRIAKAKRAKAGAKFKLSRHPRTGLLVQIDDELSDLDWTQAQRNSGYRTGGW